MSTAEVARARRATQAETARVCDAPFTLSPIVTLTDWASGSIRGSSPAAAGLAMGLFTHLAPAARERQRHQGVEATVLGMGSDPGSASQQEQQRDQHDRHQDDRNRNRLRLSPSARVRLGVL